MPAPTGRNPAHVQVSPDLLRQQSGLSAFAHKVTLGVGSTSFFTSCTAIASQYFIENAVEVGSSGSFVGSAISNLVYQVWPGSGFTVAFANGVAAMIPVTAHVKFSYQV